MGDLDEPEEIAGDFEIFEANCTILAAHLQDVYNYLEQPEEAMGWYEEHRLIWSVTTGNIAEVGETIFNTTGLTGETIQLEISPPVEGVIPEETPSPTQQGGNPQTGTSETATSRQEYIDYGEEARLLIHVYDNFRSWENAFNASPHGGMQNDLIDAMNGFSQTSSDFSRLTPPTEWKDYHSSMIEEIQTIFWGFEDIIWYIHEPASYDQYEGGGKTLDYYGQAKYQLHNIFDEFYYVLMDKYDEIGYVAFEP